MAISGRVVGALPASNMKRARDFYENTLGLKSAKDGLGGVMYECADNTMILLFESTGKASGTHTQASFEVDNLDAEVKRLKSSGVSFEEYDMPNFKSKDSIVTMEDGTRSAWFKDTEGNLIALGEGFNL